jgi:hypothetical protein
MSSESFVAGVAPDAPCIICATQAPYLQTILLASRAVALGDVSERALVAKAADRYLVSTKHKQPFGSQRSRLLAKPCWCMPSVEATFPDAQRIAYVEMTLDQEREAVRVMNAQAVSCTKVECDDALQSTPKGSVPGVW